MPRDKSDRYLSSGLADCTLEIDSPDAPPALRLGLRLVKGLSRQGAARIAESRSGYGFIAVDDLARRADLHKGDLQALAAADALASLSAHRHQASWDVAGVEEPLPLFSIMGFAEQQPVLSAPTAGQDVLADYARTGLSLRQHPLALLRQALRGQGFLNADEVALRQPGSMVRVAGLVLIRQRPGKGNAVFITLEDETGSLNLIVWRQLAERRRKVLLQAKLLAVWAEIQRADGVQHLICRQLQDHTPLLNGLSIKSRDFH